MKNVARIFGILTLLAGLTLLFGCGRISGATGPKGDTGMPGVPGQDSNPITVVNFCGVPSVYPSSFAAYGLVISSRVYAVDSKTGSYLTYLPPGIYAIGVIGNTCRFIVNANGTVSR